MSGKELTIKELRKYIRNCSPYDGGVGLYSDRTGWQEAVAVTRVKDSGIMITFDYDPNIPDFHETPLRHAMRESDSWRFSAFIDGLGVVSFERIIETSEFYILDGADTDRNAGLILEQYMFGRGLQVRKEALRWIIDHPS